MDGLEGHVEVAITGMGCLTGSPVKLKQISVG